MHRRSSISPILFIIIGLAGLGFLFQLLNEPSKLIGQLLFVLILTGIMIAVYKFVIKKRMGESGASFRKAVKQSKAKYGKTPPSKIKKIANTRTPAKKLSKKPLMNKRRNDHNLTVIEGKKGKKKNRALF